MSWAEDRWEAGRGPEPDAVQVSLALAALRDWEAKTNTRVPDIIEFAEFLAGRLLLND